ncbi:MAG: glycosyltransferase [Flavobacteriales bacterium]|nr:glycosyltransferase [Flavobacteriales bacterium]
MHILIITSWYKTENSPMKGTFFEEQARGLMKRGHQVSILFPDFKPFSGHKEFNGEEINDSGLLTIYAPFKAKFPKLKKVNYKMFQREIRKRFLDYVKKYGKPDIIHAHTVFFAGIAALEIYKKDYVPYVLTEHFTPFITGGINDVKDIQISKTVFQNAKVNIAVSHGFKELLERNLGLPNNTFEVVSNMVNRKFLENNKERNYRAPMTFKFFTMSFLTERKNHRLMLEAFKIFNDKFQNSQFIIGGEGSIKSDLINYSKELGIENKVTFLGELNRDQVVKEMGDSDVFLLASTFETFGVVLIEALALGIPVVSTDSIGPRDIITDFNGILIRTFDSIDLAEAMTKVYENYSDYSADRIRRDCMARFSEDTVLKQLDEIYQKVIGNY